MLMSNGHHVFKHFVAIYISLYIFSDPASADDPHYMQRALFLAKRSFGALAWIPVKTEPQARGWESVNDLSQARCQTLPARDGYWFLVNHLNPPEVTNSNFFAIRMVSTTKGKPSFQEARVKRNEGWFSDDGKPLAAGPSDQQRISIEDFTRLHDDDADANRPTAQRLEELVSHVGVWHARLQVELENSWDRRDVRSLFASRSHLDSSSGQGALVLAGRLMTFTAPGSPKTLRPVIFYKSNGNLDIDAIWISILGPDSGVPIVETEIRIDRPCT
jgi:hypothetical protein